MGSDFCGPPRLEEGDTVCIVVDGYSSFSSGDYVLNIDYGGIGEICP